MESNPQKALEKLIGLAGGQSELARKLSEITGLKVTQPHVSQWLHRSKRLTDVRFVIAAERAVDGEVTRTELRPDLYPPAVAIPGVERARELVEDLK